MKKNLVYFVCLISCFLYASAGAGVIFSDDFEDGVLNTAIWANESMGNGIVTETGGQLRVQSNGPDYGTNTASVRSNASATLQPGEMVVLSSTTLEMQEWTMYNFWGMRDAARQNAIKLFTDDSKWLSITITANGVSQTLAHIQDPRWIEGGWKIEWSFNKVVVTSSGWGVLFDSSDITKNGGLAWAIPAIGASMHAYSEAQLYSYWITFNDMKLETIPDKWITNVFLYDNFEDGVLNTSIWTNDSTGAGIVSEANGILTVQSNGATYGDDTGSIRSNTSATLTTGQSVVLSSSTMEMQEWGADNHWGMKDATGQNAIFLHTDSNTKWLSITITANGVSQTLPDIQDPRWIEGGWSIEWSKSKVVVTSVGWGVVFDSSDFGMNGGLMWTIPSVGTSMYAFAQAQYGTNWITFSDMYMRLVRIPPTYIDDSFDGTALDSEYWMDISLSPGYVKANGFGQFEMNAALVDGVGIQPGRATANSNVWVKPEAGEPVVIILENVRDYRQFIADEGVKEFYAQMYNDGTYSTGGTAVQFGLNTGHPGYGPLQFTIQNQATGFYDYVNPWVDPVWGTQWRTDGTWKIVWEVDRIRLYRNGEIMFDTETDAGINGTLAGHWPIPNIKLGLNLLSYWPSPQGKWTIDRVYCGPLSELQKSDYGYGYLKYDMDSSCSVDLSELSLLSEDWLLSTNPAVSGHEDLSLSTTINVPASTIAPVLNGVKAANEWNDAVVVSFDGLDPMTAPGVVGGGTHALPYKIFNLNDLSATAYLKFDNTYLYVGVEVTDSSILYNYTGNDTWLADSVELDFDLDNSDSKGFADSDVNEPDKCTKGLQLIALCGADPVGYTSDNLTSPKDITVPKVYYPETWWQAFGTWPLPASGTYFVEFKINRQNANLQTGHIYGFDIAINDSSVAGKRTNILTYKGGNGSNEALFADIVLMPKSGCGTFGYLEMDLDKNCTVDFKDFALLSDQWLLCTDPDVELCPVIFDCTANPDACK